MLTASFLSEINRNEVGIYDLFIIGNSASLPPMFLKNQIGIRQGHEIRSEVHDVAWVTRVP